MAPAAERGAGLMRAFKKMDTLFSSGFAFGQAPRPISEVAREIADVAFPSH